MSAGLMIYDKDGLVIYDMSNPALFYYGTFTASGMSGKFADARIKPGRTFLIPLSYTWNSGYSYVPLMTIENGKILWEQKEVHSSSSAHDSGGIATITFLVGGISDG